MSSTHALAVRAVAVAVDFGSKSYVDLKAVARVGSEKPFFFPFCGNHPYRWDSTLFVSQTIYGIG